MTGHPQDKRKTATPTRQPRTQDNHNRRPTAAASQLQPQDNHNQRSATTSSLSPRYYVVCQSEVKRRELEYGTYQLVRSLSFSAVGTRRCAALCRWRSSPANQPQPPALATYPYGELAIWLRSVVLAPNEVHVRSEHVVHVLVRTEHCNTRSYRRAR